jgi:hypothetical protein
MIFKSRSLTASNLDPEPWERPDGTRAADLDEAFEGMDEASVLAPLKRPRPEFEPTRDPYPWEVYYDGQPSGEHVKQPIMPHWVLGQTMRMISTVWSPRREQFDTPVNRVLADLRRTLAGKPAQSLAKQWLLLIEDDPNMSEYAVWAPLRDLTPAEIAHARKVLQRLANWKES